MQFKKRWLITVPVFLVLSGCASNVQYTDPQGVDTTSMRFSSTDLQTTTEKMVSNMLNSKSVERITSQDQRPVLFFSTIRNETSEHINTKMLENTVSTKLVNSGLFDITDMSQVEQMKDQMQYQAKSGMVDQNTAIKMGQQVGARYMVYGSIADMRAKNKSQQTLFFLVTLKMIDIKTGLMVWQGQKQIRKIEKRSFFGW